MQIVILKNQPFGKLTLVFGEIGGLNEIGTPATGPLERIDAAPSVDFGMVSRQQNIGYGSPLELSRPRVLLILQKPTAVARGERLVNIAHLVTKGTRDKANHGIRNDHSGKFAARQNIVPDTKAIIGIRICALIDSFVPAAYKEQTVIRGETLSDMLVEPVAARREKNDMRLDALRRDRLDGLGNGLDLHKHSGTAAIGLVIDRAMAIVSPIAKVIGMEIE